jgi:amino acid adenylation domain-containing protein
MPVERRESELKRLLAREAAAPFDLACGPLFRATLFQLALTQSVLLLSMHHIVSDGWSTGVLNREIAALYTAYRENRLSPLEDLRIQYADFAAWQRQWLTGAELERQAAYWRNQLQGLEPLRLEGRQRGTEVPAHRARQVFRRLKPEIKTGLARLNEKSGTTLFMLLLTCFQALLHRYTGQTDIAVGTPIANRNRIETEPLIGLFVNSLVVRVAINGGDRFSDVLHRVRTAALDAYEHQDLPFEKLVEELHPERELVRNPLFEVLFALQNAPMWAVSLPGLRIEPCPVDPPAARLELELHAWEQDDGIGLLAIYSAEVFEQPWVERMLGHFERLAQQAISDPSTRIRDFRIMGDEERERVLLDFSRTVAAPPRHGRIDEWIAEAARIYPDRVAVSSAAGELTYRELIARAASLAGHLLSLGVGPEERVAIAMGRRPELLVAMLGIFGAGAAYVPLDPRYPAERLQFMLRDSGAHFVITHSDDPVPQFAGVVAVCVDIPNGERRGQPPSRKPADALAYVIYTSGSTGLPKGVSVEHRGIAALALWAGEVFSAEELQGMVASTSICFDVSVFELFTPLAHGGHVRIVPDALHLEEAGENARVLSTVPSAAWELVRGDRLPHWAHTVLLCGEVLNRALVEELEARGAKRVINAYGPTEETVFSTWAEIGRVDDSVPIGRPVHHTRAYVVDSGFQLQPVGASGELWLGGAGVARGYHNRPELTAERFVVDTFTGSGGRLYRTGDLARWREDGQLEFLGRLDQQIKLRGFRIEPGEIEHVLRSHPGVDDCAVIPQHGNLIAYVVPRKAQSGDEGSTDTSPESDHVAGWQDLFDNTYDNAEANDFAAAGWIDSLSNEPIPVAEMRDWRDNALAILREQPARRILDIGCGTGLLLSEMARDAAEYNATDVSPVALEHVRRMAKRHGLSNVRIESRPAHVFEPANGPGHDLVILNSVVQYFPGIRYLANVIRGAVRATADGGRVFIGDVRSLPLLEAFQRSVVEHRAGSDLSPRRLPETAHRDAWRETELAIDSAWFGLLRNIEPRIGAVEVRLKRGRFHNELSRFRYDVILHIGSPAVEEMPEWLEWNGIAALENLLRHRTSFGIKRIPNGRLAKRSDADAVDPETLADVAAGAGYRVDLSWSPADAEGHIDAAFRPLADRMAVVAMPVVDSAPAAEDWARFATDPFRARANDQLMERLRVFLESRLPGYMVPADFLDVARLPMAPNGKLDRATLPGRFGARPENAGRCIEPSTPTELELTSIWQQILGMRRIGVDDDFFLLGGHSLLATQVMSRIRMAFGVEVPLREIFLRPTVARLAALVDERLSLPGTPVASMTFDEGEV